MHLNKYYFTYLVALYGIGVLLNRTLRQNGFNLSSSIHVLPPQTYLSFKSAIADYLWFDLLIGKTEANFYHRVNYITDLDIHFNNIYRYAVLYLITVCNNPKDAQLLLKKSLQSPLNRADWRLYCYQLYLQPRSDYLAFCPEPVSDKLKLLAIGTTEMPQWLKKTHHYCLATEQIQNCT